MHRRTRFPLVATVLTAAALFAGSRSAPSGVAAWASPDDAVAAWDQQRDRAVADSVKEYERLRKWCLDKNLARMAIRVRAFILRYAPDDAEVRAALGYVRADDGRWVRDAARWAEIRAIQDIEDPSAQKFRERQAAATTKVVNVWRPVALTAKKSGDSDPSNSEAWRRRADEAWERVLEADSRNEAAHQALGHPKFGDTYVRPEAVRFLEVRRQRTELGRKHGSLELKIEAVAPDGPFAKAGFSGGAARSEHLYVVTSHGKDAAAKSALWGERGLRDFVEVYGLDPVIGQRLPIRRFAHMRNKPELERYLSEGAGWDLPRARQLVEQFGGTSGIGDCECVSIRSAGADAQEHVLHWLGHAVAMAGRNTGVQEYGSPSDRVEDWLVEAMASDVTRRLLPREPPPWSGSTRPSAWDETEPVDSWIRAFRHAAEEDDDVPLARLAALTFGDREIHGPEIVKGWAFLQFLFEDDTARAREFVRRALAVGSAAAARAVYDCDLDALDRRCRKWVLLTW